MLQRYQIRINSRLSEETIVRGACLFGREIVCLCEFTVYCMLMNVAKYCIVFDVATRKNTLMKSFPGFFIDISLILIS